MTTSPYSSEFQEQVQGLALTGYNDACVRHLLLRVQDAGLSRRFLAELLEAGLLSFGDKALIAGNGTCPINLGFSYEGLLTLGAPEAILAVLKERSLAFADGAIRRASRYLGDGGRSAPDRWDPTFFPLEPHVWIAIHGSSAEEIGKAAARLRALPSAPGLVGWTDGPGLSGQHIKGTGALAGARMVPFGFRDSITRPRIDGAEGSPPAGELVLGYENVDNVDLWTDKRTTPDHIAAFLRHGSFGVLRKIEQHEADFDDYLQSKVKELIHFYPHISADYLKAKMCGRWPNGYRVLPGQWVQPKPMLGANDIQINNFKTDRNGLGCPFGAHIRRANPRDDDLVPQGLKVHTLFRRGVPYEVAADATDTAEDTRKDSRGAGGTVERGLLAVFFCARIEDQLERLVSEWLEKKPMGPPNRGRSKDPLSGNHDDPDADFIIPLDDGNQIKLQGFTPFLRTRGTLYALFPSRQALNAITGWLSEQDDDDQANAAAAQAQAARPAGPRAAAQAAPQPAAGGPGGAAPQQDASDSDAEDEAGPDFMDVPTDRFCDVVMEGGITSGVIYASAAVELGRHYRFRGIGGSSIGAFAAALAAAAEYRRRKGSGEGFDLLEKLPEQLAEEKDGRTLLERLFIPQKKTRRLFNIFLASLERENTASLLLHGLVAALQQYRKAVGWTVVILLVLTLAGPALALANCLWSLASFTCVLGFFSWGMAALLSVVVAIAGALLAASIWDFIHGLVPNGFGLCRGWRAEENPATVDLAGFLHASIQRIAGRFPKDDPLTFEDLWNAPGSAAQALGYKVFTPAAARSINLEVYSSNLAHSRPYRFPLEETEDMGRLFFRAKELEYYFPKRVVLYLMGYAKAYKARSSADPPEVTMDSDYLELPVGKLPVVVAVRLAMSFPLLISAVPLYAIDHGRQRMERCWMSDGGLCSNFPIHLFDSFVPKWPTFGISLQMRQSEHKLPVSLPEFHTSGRADYWDRGSTESTSGLGKLGGFLLSLWKTTWRWNDSTMMRMPGVRDRVVRVYIEKDEGGVNIRMKAAKIRRLGECLGKAAAAAFVKKFATPESVGWQEHRWVRFNCMLLSLRARIQGISEASRLNHHTVPLQQQIDEARLDAPLRKPERRTRIWPSEVPLTPEQAQELQAQLEALCVLEEAFEAAGNTVPYRAVPLSSMRIRHPT